MARSDSEIGVAITGDASNLISTLAVAEGATSKFGSHVKGIVGGILAVGALKKGFDFLQDSVSEADRLDDATKRVNTNLGTFASLATDNAGAFKKLGLSPQDVLEISANFSDLAKKAGISQFEIGKNADKVAEIAAAVSLLGDKDPEQVVTDIGRAAAGQQKAYAGLGVSIDEAAVIAEANATRFADAGRTYTSALTPGELATARLKLIMEQLSPKIDLVTGANAGLEESQRTLQASVETLQGKIGGPLSDALKQVVDFINDEVDAIPGAIEGLQLLGKQFEDLGRTALGPLGNIRDALGGIGDAINNVNQLFGGAFGHATGGRSEGEAAATIRRFRERNGLP